MSKPGGEIVIHQTFTDAKETVDTYLMLLTASSQTFFHLKECRIKATGPDGTKKCSCCYYLGRVSGE
nr:hypothetical protein [Tanacetum cinerariifolium]